MGVYQSLFIYYRVCKISLNWTYLKIIFHFKFCQIKISFSILCAHISKVGLQKKAGIWISKIETFCISYYDKLTLKKHNLYWRTLLGDWNRPNWLTVSDIINLTVQYDLVGLINGIKYNQSDRSMLKIFN